VIGEKQFWKLVEPPARSVASSRGGKTKRAARDRSTSRR
jgi:hypothetical protein